MHGKENALCLILFRFDYVSLNLLVWIRSNVLFQHFISYALQEVVQEVIINKKKKATTKKTAAAQCKKKQKKQKKSLR